jgi:hypothetical protein
VPETSAKTRPGDVQPRGWAIHIAHAYEGEPEPTHYLCGQPIRGLLGSTTGRVRGKMVCAECARLDNEEDA